VKKFFKKVCEPWSPASASFSLSGAGMPLALFGRNKGLRFAGATMCMVAGIGGCGANLRVIADLSQAQMQPVDIMRKFRRNSKNEEFDSARMENAVASFVQHLVPAVVGLVGFWKASRAT